MADADRAAKIAEITRLEKIARIQELEAQDAKSPEKTSAVKAGLIGAQDAVTFGGRAALGAAAEALGTGLQTLGNTGSISKAYENAKLVFNPARKELTAERNKAFSDQPVASIAGNVAGNLATAPLIAAKGISGAIKLGTLGGLGTAASEADTLADAGKIVGTGAAVGGAIGGLGKLGGMAADKFKSAGSKSAFKALGPNARDAKLALKKDQIEDIGEALIKEKILPKTPSSASTIVKNIENKLKPTGKALNDSIEKLDEVITKKGVDEFGVSMNKVASEVYKDIRSKGGVPGAISANAKAKQFIKELVATNPKFKTVGSTEELKRLVDDQINYNKLSNAPDPLQEKFLKSLANKLRSASENAAEKVAKAESNPQLAKAFKESKGLYSLLSQAKKIVSDKDGRATAANFLSPSDKAAGMLGVLGGVTQGEDLGDKVQNAIIGGSLGLANKGLRTMSTQQGSQALYNFGNFLQNNATKNMGAVGRTAIQQTSNALSRRLRGE